LYKIFCLLHTQESVVETDESYNLAEQLLLLKHLKVVEIKCYKEDEVVHKIVSILSTFGVLPEQIDIEQNFFRAPESKFNIITLHDSLILMFVLTALSKSQNNEELSCNLDKVV
jgi:hypothetical protein